jgi:hypothetical protein
MLAFITSLAVSQSSTATALGKGSEKGAKVVGNKNNSRKIVWDWDGGWPSEGVNMFRDFHQLERGNEGWRKAEGGWGSGRKFGVGRLPGRRDWGERGKRGRTGISKTEVDKK